MDVDNESSAAVEFDLVNSFRSMNTNDKDYLISEFKRLSNTQLSNEGCCFYLDLAEWNLNTALWAYYEYDSPAHAQEQMQAPEMKFICDVTIGEGESVPPNTKFIKTWRIKNTGNRRWPSGCNLKLVNGHNLNTLNESDSYANNLYIHVDSLQPNEQADISIELKSPQISGLYQTQYRLFTSNNIPFGDPIWLVLNVEETGVLGITQQLNNVKVFNSTSSSHDSLSPSSSSTSSSSNYNLKSTSTSTNSNLNADNPITHNVNDEKRPDFYDDMFS